MAVTAIDPPSILPVANEGETTMVVKKLSEPQTQKVEPVGRWYEAYLNRLYNKHSVSHHSVESSSSDESEDDTEIEDNTQFLMSLDPKDWKNQDHYKVLGLAKLRYKATEDQIKKAYKRQVLHHHPDKRKARGLNVKEGDDDYFTCITRAWETLGVPAKRRSFDSVDPEFEDDVPPNNALAKEKFFKVFRPIFEMNARWSKKQKVPELGDENTPYDDVDDFYGFWYDFDSWREFSYLDEEEKEKGENRDERRWIEKQNKAARQKRKKEETSRIRQLVDNAYACDPRVMKFKEDEKAKKIAMKKAKQDAIKQRQEAEEKQRRDAEEEERLIKQKEADKIKARVEAAKKEREEQDKAFKRERKLLMAAAREKNYFASNDDERVKNILDVDKLARLLSLVSLKELNEKITSSDDERAKAAYLCEVLDLKEHELQWVLNHLGHTLDVHKIHYRCTSDILERTQIAKILLLQDHDRLGEFRNKTLQDIDMHDIVTEKITEETEQKGDPTSNIVLNKVVTDNEWGDPAGLQVILNEAENFNDFSDDDDYDDDECRRSVQKKKRKPTSTSKTKWTEDEEGEIKTLFKKFFEAKKRPKPKDCLRALEQSRKRNGFISQRKKDVHVLKKKRYFG